MLHSHPDPAMTLEPLLRAHLPRSLPALGSLLFHLKLPSPPSAPFAFASFPPTTSDTPPDAPWVVLMHQQPPSTNQLRVFSSVESAVAAGAQPGEEELAAAEAQLRACLKAFGMGREEVWIGALSELWIDRLGLAKDHIYGVWLAPQLQEGADEVAVQVPDGLVLRAADERDIRVIVDTSEVKRPDAYISSICPFSSLLSKPDGTAVAWILSHSDYSVGALFTQPEARRRGLAHVVVRDRLQGMRQAGVRAWCCIADTNVPSQRFWTSFGWTKGWDSAWHHIPLSVL